VQCVLLNNDVDPIVRRARSKLSMRWRYAEAQATVLLNDGFAVLDRERPDVDSKLGDNDSDWFDVSGDRVGKRHALPLVARFTNDRWDNTVGVCDRFDTRLDDGALGSFHGSRRVTQFLQWAAPSPLARVTQAERRELRLAVSTASRRLRATVCARSSTAPAAAWRAASTRPLSRSGCARSRSLPFHCKRPAYEAPTKKMLKYCGDELDPKSRTMLDYHPVEVARQNGAGGARRLLCSCDRAS